MPVAPYVFLVTIDEVQRSEILDDSHLGLWALIMFGTFLAFTPSQDEAYEALRIARKRNPRGEDAAA